MIKIRWLGCAGYILDLDGTKIMFDPFFYRQTNENTRPVLKTKREDIKDIISAIFITHGHFDHITDAGWFAEFRNIPVYSSKVARENIIKWAQGRIFREHGHELTDKGKSNLHIVQEEEIVKINENLSVEVIKSAHIKFDDETIQWRLKNREFRKQMKNLTPLIKELPQGRVFAYCIHYKDKKIVTYGSLYEKFKDTYRKFKDCHIFIPPLAGNSAQNMAKVADVMVEILKPKIIIPTHGDDFWPPISRFEDLGPFNQLMEEKYPNIRIVNLEIDNEMVIEL